MHNVSDNPRPDSSCSISDENRDITTAFTGYDFYEDITVKANCVPIDHIFRHYGLNINKYNNKIICPFKSHKGGRETTPSFKYYADTNSYCCFGCRIGHTACDFVSEMDNISLQKAAEKILNIFDGEIIDDESFINRQDVSKKLEIMMQFSNFIREFRQLYLDVSSQNVINEICETYDKINLKYELTNEALQSLVVKLQQLIHSRINKYE